MIGRLLSNNRYYSWGDHWGWHIGFSRSGLQISTPFVDIKIQRRTRWYGEKTCLVCGQGHSGAHPDPCLGELKEIVGACCGHGDRTDAYIGFENGTTIREFLVSTPYDGELDPSDWISDEDPEDTSRVIDVLFPVYVDNLETSEDYESLGRLAVEVALDRVENAKKIQRAAGITPRRP